MNLSHYSDEPTIEPCTITQTNRRRDKPVGLWVSADGEDDWPSWCAAENYCDTASQTRHVVALADDADVLTLASMDDLHAFTELFGVSRSGLPIDDAIDWCLVASLWQGVIIAPYQWPARLTVGWYYSWDCASGCIWDAAAIASVEPVRQAVMAS